MTKTKIAKRISSALSVHSLSLDKLTQSAEQVVVFGSWALGAERVTSDVDLFCVGNGNRLKKNFADIVWMVPDDVMKPKWLGSELANHIAKYGIWLKGKGDWRKSVFVSAKSVSFKKLLIRSRVNALEKLWDTLGREYRIKHVVKLRRDVQRLTLMLKGKAVEPSPWLDLRWIRLGRDRAALMKLLTRCGVVEMISPRQWRLFGPYLRFSDWQFTN